MQLFLLLLLLLPTWQETNDSNIHVTVVDGRGGVGGVIVTFTSEDGAISGHCATAPRTGVCNITGLQTPPGLVRGHLTIGSFGQRAVVWPGGYLAVEIDITDGLLQPSHLPHMDGAGLPDVLPIEPSPTAIKALEDDMITATAVTAPTPLIIEFSPSTETKTTRPAVSQPVALETPTNSTGNTPWLPIVLSAFLSGSLVALVILFALRQQQTAVGKEANRGTDRSER